MTVRVGSIGAVYYGLSTDTKPSVDNGHWFIETNTNTLFVRLNSVWVQLTSGPPIGMPIDSTYATRFSIPGWFSRGTSANLVSAAGFYAYFPFYINRTRTFDRLVMNVVTAAVAGSVARLGIYNATLNSTGITPSSLVVDGGTVAVDTTGEKSVVISQTLSPGYYFLVEVNTGTPTVTIFLGDGATSTTSSPIEGGAPLSYRPRYISLQRSGQDATVALIDPAPAPDDINDTDLSLVWLRETI